MRVHSSNTLPLLFVLLLLHLILLHLAHRYSIIVIDIVLNRKKHYAARSGNKRYDLPRALYTTSRSCVSMAIAGSTSSVTSPAVCRRVDWTCRSCCRSHSLVTRLRPNYARSLAIVGLLIRSASALASFSSCNAVHGSASLHPPPSCSVS